MKTSVLIINIITLVSVLILVSIVVFRFIRDTLRHRRTMRKLSEWSAFHNQLSDWASEIGDSKIRDEFVSECIQKLISHNSENMKLIRDFDLELEKEKVFNKWGSHIASLRQEIRHKRLKKLV